MHNTLGAAPLNPWADPVANVRRIFGLGFGLALASGPSSTEHPPLPVSASRDGKVSRADSVLYEVDTVSTVSFLSNPSRRFFFGLVGGIHVHL